jgi:hypothetical protein
LLQQKTPPTMAQNQGCILRNIVYLEQEYQDKTLIW